VPGEQGHATGPTYDEALAEPEDVMALQGERELTNAELAAPLKNPEFLSACGVPDATSVTVKIAVRDGAVIGASVYVRPDDAQMAECVDRAVRALAWPASKRRDSFVTTY
jgi:hypothetical protein